MANQRTKNEPTNEPTNGRACTRAHTSTTRANSIAVLAIARSRSAHNRFFSHIRDSLRASVRMGERALDIPPLGRSKDKGSTTRPADPRRSEEKGGRSARVGHEAAPGAATRQQRVLFTARRRKHSARKHSTARQGWPSGTVRGLLAQ